MKNLDATMVYVRGTVRGIMEDYLKSKIIKGKNMNINRSRFVEYCVLYYLSDWNDDAKALLNGLEVELKENGVRY